MKLQARAYFDEAKWLNQQQIPTVEEYLSVALPSSGYIMLATISFLGMGDITTEHAFKWSLSNHAKAIRASTIISRLTNGIVTHKVNNIFEVVNLNETNINKGENFSKLK